MRIVSTVGKVFGKLISLYEFSEKGGNRRAWCKCECGTFKVVLTAGLRGGRARSCGCANGNIKHGQTVGRSSTQLYNSWRGMVERCTNKNHSSYKRYGGAGISVCEEWRTFDSFSAWAKENGYTPGLTIDRKDSSAGYSAENCRWVTKKENGALAMKSRFGWITTDTDRQEIFTLRISGAKPRDIARRFSISESRVRQIVREVRRGS